MAELYCPLPVSIHPEAFELDERAAAWMLTCPPFEGEEQRARLLGSHSGAFVACGSPHGLRERLEVGGRWFFLGFAVDDWLETLALDLVVEACWAMQRIVEDPSCGAGSWLPFGSHFAEVFRSMRSMATERQYQHIVVGYRAYHLAIPIETRHQSCGTMPPLQEQVAIRLGLSLFEAFIAATEIYNDQSIPDQEYYRADVRALREVTAILLCWANDIFSIAKDTREATFSPASLVCALATERHCTTQDATEHAIELWNRTMVLYLKLRDKISPGVSPQLTRWLGDCDNMIANIIGWHTSNPRYDVLVPVTATATEPEGLSTAPIPFCARWWTQLGENPASAPTPHSRR